jgi:hypothetical protein
MEKSRDCIPPRLSRPEHRPIHIRSQILATDRASCGFLYFRAALCRHTPDTICPLIDGRRRDTKQRRQLGLTANNFERFLNRMHG